LQKPSGISLGSIPKPLGREEKMKHIGYEVKGSEVQDLKKALDRFVAGAPKGRVREVVSVLHLGYDCFWIVARESDDPTSKEVSQ
jgi:hypothetical protein